ncbi:hypothetical protein Pint_16631 [Pistacia integerrima]|uniref:Uncharacterized protein n=1 Tax=Pistacia integerrima TaxID=434235 RepID=A0ACC0ZCZ1_9ROSI|nr:hypothetical protein Pint_16631 [Pistacia integerrima]
MLYNIQLLIWLFESENTEGLVWLWTESCVDQINVHFRSEKDKGAILTASSNRPIIFFQHVMNTEEGNVPFRPLLAKLVIKEF